MASLQLSASVFDPLARRVAARLHEAGFQSVFAGGCVRDALLGRAPKDTDIATNATPDEVARVYPGARFIGKAFGVTLVSEGGRYFEVATFRQDISYSDGRRPDVVKFAGAEADAHRRDFTINGLFYEPSTSTILDFVGGCDDVQRRIVRAIGDAERRFEEDHLRLLRAVRFANTLNFTIAPETFSAIKKLAPKINRISPERIFTELTRIWVESKQPGKALEMLRETGLLAETLPEVLAMAGVEQPPQFHPEGDAFTHTALALDQLKSPDAKLAWAVLLHDVGKPPTYTEEKTAEGVRIHFHGHAGVGAQMADEILRRLRASNEFREAVVHSVKNHMRFIDWPNMKQATRRKIVAHPLFPMDIELHRADCLASNGALETHQAALKEYERLQNEVTLPRAWVTGHDLMKLGVPEGPTIALWRQRAFDAQLENKFANRADLLAWLAEAIRAEFPEKETGSDSASPTPPRQDPSADSST